MIIKYYSKVAIVARDANGEEYDHYTLDDHDEYTDAFIDTIEGPNYNDDLAQYANKEYDGFDKDEVMSIVITFENNYLVANCVLADGVDPDMPVEGNRGSTLKEALADWLEGQYSDGWGEGLADEVLGEDEIDDDFADPNDYADEDGEIPDDWEDMVDPITVYYYGEPWDRGFKFDKIEVVGE